MPARTLVRRLAAFTLDPAGGNPAGVWIGPELPEPAQMQRIAAEVGFSETAFLAPDGIGRPSACRSAGRRGGALRAAVLSEPPAASASRPFGRRRSPVWCAAR